MDQVRSSASRIFNITSVEGRDDWDEKCDRTFGVVQNLINDLSEKEAHDALTSAVCKDAKTHEDVCVGLVYMILTDQQNAARSYRDLSFVSRDGLALVLSHLTQLVVERFPRLLDSVRSQLMWLIKELVRANVTGTDMVIWNLMRQIAGGDVAARNIWLADTLMDLLIDQRAWLDKFPFLIASVVYTYLRLIEDHISPTHAFIRQKEINFCVSLLREKFSDCMAIGRDLVRLLQHVARVPEFELLWRDILHNPKALLPTFTGLSQLMQIRTSRRFLFLRLTPDMEKKMVFLTTSVRFGNQKRYQDWFQRQYLSTPESQSLRCDLIRFIVGVIHPSNEVLCSDIIPRWAILGWLLTTCTHPVAASNAKMALFYDWLFYDAERDNIMNIEPAILVMYHSMRPHPAITATLLDFLCRIIPNFYPPMANQVRLGILTSLRQILEKRVLPSLSPLMTNPKLDKELQLLIQESFPEFCRATQNSSPPTIDGVKSEDFKEIDGESIIISSSSESVLAPPSLIPASETTHEPVFSDDEDQDDIPIATKIKMRGKMTANSVRTIPPQLLEISNTVAQLDGDVRVYVEMLISESDIEARCSAVENLVQSISQDPLESEQAQMLVQCLHAIFLHDLSTTPLLTGHQINPEAMEESISRPLFVLLRSFAEMVDDDSKSRSPIAELLVELYKLQPKMGYFLLYFLRASKASESKFASYREVCQARDMEVAHCLLEDLKICADDDVNLLCYMAVDVFQKFPDESRNNSELLHLYVSNIDGTQLYQLVVQCLHGALVLFDRDPSVIELLASSLEWETFEQMALWQLVAAHSIPLSLLLSLLPKLKEGQHCEALTALLAMIKHERPNNDLMKALLNCPIESFVSALLSHWSMESSTNLAPILANQFNSALNMNSLPGGLSTSSSPGKRKRTTMNSLSAATGFKVTPTPGSGIDSSIELIMTHMEILRTCLTANLQTKNGKQQPAEIKVFAHESMQQALQQVQQVCNDSQKKKFSDLFSLLDTNDEPEVSSGSRRPAGRGSKRTGNRLTTNNSNRNSKQSNKEESEEESSEEEVIIKQRTAKKRRKATVGSDSD
ncbi:integrator complex subunit 3-like [Daphnia carinata]|uniref:integrator complex subunit 3-like n=1 Tax=Daphnia carinata TaxID=120202 RepID=UPI00257BAC7A|nr:integrator complex subunit 3-like [Daphnia carinata]